MTPTYLEQSIRIYVRSVCELSDERVIFARMAGPSPATDFATVRLLSAPTKGDWDSQVVSTEDEAVCERRVRFVIEGTASVELRGPNHRDLAMRFRCNQANYDLQQGANGRGFVFVDVLSEQDGSQLADPHWIERTVIDFRFRASVGFAQQQPVLADIAPTFTESP